MDFEKKINRLLGNSRNGRIGINIFENEFPELVNQIRRVRNSPFLKIWGQSNNLDELENSTIVDPKLLTTIGRIANVEIRDGKSYHAGLIHTYGYLFSQLQTKYGLKRDRWTSGIIEKGLGIAERCFSPTPPNGTLFSNVSFLLSRIALKRATNLTDDTTSPMLKSFHFQGLSGTTIFETCRHTSKKKTIQLVTDIVDFRKTVKKCSSLLVYSTIIGRKQSLITCFPIDKQNRSDLLRIAKTNSTPIEARFNLALKDFPPDGVFGERTVQNLKL